MKIIEKSKYEKTAGLVFAFLSAASYGTLPVFSRIAHSFGFTGYVQVLARSIFAMFFLALTLAYLKESLSAPLNKIYKWILLGFFHTAASVTLFSSFSLIPIGVATTIHFTYPVIVTLFSVLFLKEKGSLKIFAALLLSVIGMAVLVYKGGNQFSIRGIILAGASGVLYSAYIIGLDMTGAKHENNFRLTFYLALSSVTILSVISIFSGFNQFQNLTINFKSLSVLAGIGMLGSYIALITFQKGVKFIGASKTSIISSLEPVISIYWGSIIFHEILTLKVIIGIVLILSATIIVVMEK